MTTITTRRSRRGDRRSPPGGIAESGDVAGGIATGDGEGLDGRYPGGKGVAGLWQWIIGHMPTHAFYAEPYAGKGAVLRNKPPALISHVVDKSAEVVAWWRELAPAGVCVHHGCGERWLQAMLGQGRLDADWCIYLDPPYPHSTRVKLQVYDHELTAADHDRLLGVILEVASTGAAVLVSSYPSDQYDQALGGWYRAEREVITRGATLRTEVLWCSRAPGTTSPALAVEYSQLGRDFRQRERVSRKVGRWVRRVLEMPPGEQDAIMRALIDATAGRRVPGSIVGGGGAGPGAPLAADADGSSSADTSADGEARGSTGTAMPAATAGSGDGIPSLIAAMVDPELRLRLRNRPMEAVRVWLAPGCRHPDLVFGAEYSPWGVHPEGVTVLASGQMSYVDDDQIEYVQGDDLVQLARQSADLREIESVHGWERWLRARIKEAAESKG